MGNHSLAHLSDADLTRDIAALVTRDRVGTALLLAHLAEFDARKLYGPAGYPSMFAYCVGDLHFSEPEASRRIQAARLAREFPILLRAVAAGRLHLSGICLLAPHFTNEDAEELIEAATHRSKREIELLLAVRFPDALPEQSGHALIRPVRVRQGVVEAQAFVPRSIGPPLLELPLESAEQRVNKAQKHLPGDVHEPFESPHKRDELEAPRAAEEPGPVTHPLAPEPGPITDPPARAHHASPPSPEHYLLRLTIRRGTHDKLRELQALLSHAVPGAEVAEVLDRAFDLALVHLKRRKFGFRTGRRVDRSGHRGHSPAR